MRKRSPMWAHLPRPFSIGEVIPSNRHPSEFHFTFRDADGETYHWRISDLPTVEIAAAKMQEFVNRENTVRV